MKLQYNGKQILELNETQKKVIKNDIPSSVFDSDMTRRCKYWLECPVEKHAHANRKKFEDDLKGKGRANVPVKLEKLAARHAEDYPPAYGLDDIKAPVQCKVGDMDFQLDVDYLKGWRKLLEARQEVLSKDDYMKEEEKELCDRMAWILQHKYERCFERLKLEWNPKLEARGLTEVPADPDAFAELVFSQPDYKDRSQREEEVNSGR